MTSFKDYLDINPMRTLAAILGFGQAVLVVIFVTVGTEWGQPVQLAVNTAWVACVGVFMSFFKNTAVIEETTVTTTEKTTTSATPPEGNPNP